MNRAQRRKFIHNLRKGPAVDPALSRGAFSEPSKTSAAGWERKYLRRGIVAGLVAGVVAAAVTAQPIVSAIVAVHVALTGAGAWLIWRALNRMRPVDE